MSSRVVASIFLLVALGAAAASAALMPTRWLFEDARRTSLEEAVPRGFGDWRLDTAGAAAIINPQTQQVLDKIYSETLSRTYVNAQGYRVMLSIAYGRDQRDSMQLHYPEVCYPAQGFTVLANDVGEMRTGWGVMPVRRLSTNLGGRRPEPVTYWTTVGDKAVLGGTDKKFAEMSYGFRGLIPDGLLFRVSSIDADVAKAYGIQDEFVRQLLAASQPLARLRLAGIAPDKAAQ